MNSLSAKIYYPFICICTFAFISCNDDEIVYPEGGYSYLKNIAASDSNFYFLPIRQLIPRRDSLQAVDIKYLYMGFNEPNLSLNPHLKIFLGLFLSADSVEKKLLLLFHFWLE